MPTKIVSLRIDEKLLDYLTERAKSEHRSLSNLIISIILDEKESTSAIETIKTLARNTSNCSEDYKRAIRDCLYVLSEER